VGSIGPLEIVVILVVALVVLGPNRLPDAARSVGKAMAELRRMTTGFQSEVRDAFAEPPTPARRPTVPAEPVALPTRPEDADITARVEAAGPDTPEPLAAAEAPAVEVPAVEVPAVEVPAADVAAAETRPAD